MRESRIIKDIEELFPSDDPRVKELMKRKESRKRQPPPTAPPGGINMSNAARLYGINYSTLSRWVNKGLIPILLETIYVKYIDEATLIKVIERYRESPGRGRWTVRKAFAS